jgi:hypothetical protein
MQRKALILLPIIISSVSCWLSRPIRECVALTLPCILLGQSASARNLPESTGARGDHRGETVALLPIIRIEKSLKAAEKALPDLSACSKALATIPAKEKDFKRLFDEYSEGVSYKQQYLDSNAFLVYYTQGFDGPGRESIEKESDATLKQEAQFGYRNDAAVALDEARAELDFQQTQSSEEVDLKELENDLKDADVALHAYIKLAPPAQVAEAVAQLIGQ